MNAKRARKLFERYSAAVVCMEVQGEDGTPGVGSAFHVGEGVFVTARHVVEDQRIVSVSSKTSWRRKPTPEELDENAEWRGGWRRTLGGLTDVAEISAPVFHPNGADVAAFTGTPQAPLPTIPLGGHLDDWIGDEFLLSAAVLLGYPPIPLSREPLLVCVRAEVNAVLDKSTGGSPSFIMSATARGGFSGGVALSEWGFALGVITEGLVTRDDQPLENAFFAVLAVEPIYECLRANNILPKRQSKWAGGSV
jgi:hypothetical protein